LAQTFPAQGEWHELSLSFLSTPPSRQKGASKKKKEKENRWQRQIVAKALKMRLGSL
jgi:hypothetical protein